MPEGCCSAFWAVTERLIRRRKKERMRGDQLSKVKGIGKKK